MGAAHKYPYNWTLKDAVFTKDKGRVFSCFACGGGSTMGYKLAGFDVIGCNEIDHRMMYAYCQNHNPKLPFLEPIQDFKNRQDLPDELFNLDVLDGSPPCSTFSMAGSREDAWGVEKRFREGQSVQVLDTLFFDFIELAQRIQPKVVVAENVKGLFMGNAIQYVTQIYDAFSAAGYFCQHFLLNAKDMGVPQNRERVFFICLRKDIAKSFLRQVSLFDLQPQIDMRFNEPHIPFREIYSEEFDRPLTDHYKKIWDNRSSGDSDMSDAWGRMGNNPNAHFNRKYLYMDKVANTIPAHDWCVLFDEPRLRNKMELQLCGSFPTDYDYGSEKPEYVIGMSVPPVMMAQIASRIHEQWLSRL